MSAKIAMRDVFGAVLFPQNSPTVMPKMNLARSFLARK